MTTATITDLELLRTRVSGAVGSRMPEHIARLGWDAGRLAVLSGTGCGRCWPAPSRARPSTPDGSAASTRTGSSSPTWPGCR